MSIIKKAAGQCPAVCLHVQNVQSAKRLLRLDIQSVRNGAEGREWEYNLHDMTDNHVPVDGTNAAAVVGVVSMVAHHKVLAIRYGEGSEIVQITGTIVIIDVRFVILLVIDIEINRLF